MKADQIITRYESADIAEWKEIRNVHQAAFGQSDEADLVDALRAAGVVLLSLVAECQGRIVGHVLFSRMWIETTHSSMPAAALAPVAVLAERQRQGIGARLIRRGLDVLRERDERVVIVLGHPEYYSRFGFSTDKARNLESPFPPEAFMAMELVSGALDGVHGRVRYADAFAL